MHYVDKNPYAYYFAKSLEKYTLKSDEGGLWSLAYSLTPNGRADFRKRNIEGFKIEDKNWLGFFNISDYSSDDESDYSTPDGEEVILALDDLQSEDAETNIAASEEEDDSDLPDNEEYYIHLNTNFTDHLQAAKGVLKKLLQNRGFNEKDAEDTITHYNGYIESCVETFSFLKTSKDDYSWIQIRNTFPTWEDIGDIAIRLLSSSVSEASCERTIKRQRYVLDCRRMRTTKQLHDARMILNSC